MSTQGPLGCLHYENPTCYSNQHIHALWNCSWCIMQAQAQEMGKHNQRCRAEKEVKVNCPVGNTGTSLEAGHTWRHLLTGRVFWLSFLAQKIKIVEIVGNRLEEGSNREKQRSSLDISQPDSGSPEFHIWGSFLTSGAFAWTLVSALDYSFKSEKRQLLKIRLGHMWS